MRAILLTMLLCGSAMGEVRGTWLTTTANDAISTPEKTAATIKRLREIGLNTVYIECWKNGYTEFPSETLRQAIGISHKPDRDLLKEAITEAHRNQLAAIAWFEYGFMAAFRETSNELRQKKDWILRDKSGGEIAPDGMVWMNPIHPEVRKLLLGIVLDAVKNYDLDGVQLDDRLAWPGNNMGYDDYTRAAYAKEHNGQQPPDKEDDPEWIAWRANKVSEFARGFYQTVHKARPDILISLSPSPYPWSYEHHATDWPAWAKAGLFDEFVPQIYRDNYARFDKDYREQIAAIGQRKRDLIAGIRVVGDGPNTPWEDLRKMVDLTRALGGGGHCWWFSRGVLDVYAKEIAAYYGGWVPHPKRNRAETRAVWITRGEYRTPDDVRRIVATSADMGFNTLLFQVRGNGTVFYKSQIEPWAWELSGDSPDATGKDPGWDPLAVALDEAHKRGVELHAWVNVFPAWRSQRFAPRESKQLWWAHPDWFMCDASGQRMVPRDRRFPPKQPDWYSFLSPGVPEVQTYLADVCEELVRNYAIDGLHYDYIRYPREIREVAPQFKDRAAKLGNWSYDPVSLKRFTEETGIAKPDDDPAKWTTWRAQQVTDTVRKIAARVRPIRPGLVISAAVGADPNDARDGKGQDYARWLTEGYIDLAVTMNYTPDLAKFTDRAKLLLEHRPPKGLVVQGFSGGSAPEAIAAQIAAARKLGANGFCAFSFGSLVDRQKKPRPGIAEIIKAP